ncbi:uncharacterized protein C8A04DRAFT_15691 [Dichotomopilus funicola]|uniref:R3H domain protein n=1 Tax=Dichotomopilus funicola TaxID=1934379 RepID=A0AAN6UUV2_9PEZI|nr:hypothetical protein C8A04DRAFT_15691 [Dichotomopilus funicola]
MNQQPDLYFPGYGMSTANRSPRSSRPGYNTTTGHSGVNRMDQRQMDPVGQAPNALFATEDRFGSYNDSAFRHNRMQASPGFAGDNLIGNAQWGYNPGVNTVTGALGEGRLRSGARRAIPQEWTMPEQPGIGNQALPPVPPAQYPAVGSFNPAMGLMNGDATFTGERHGYPSAMYDPRHEPKALGNDLIPTAIVIKNIPFNVRKEMLTTIMSELGLPQPYAFNYHFDNGIFRGLAFANFQNPVDTQTVIEQLNGYEVQGRKLRVEYKKMLPEHERERIEREKREKRGQLEEQHQPMPLHSQSSMHSLNAAHTSRTRSSPLRKSPGEVPTRGAASNQHVGPGDVDLNNPDTLSFYTELMLFKSDPSREIIVFPSTITPQQRRTVHILAHNMGLEHRSVGEGQHRQIHVIKDTGVAAPAIHMPPGVSADAHRRGLSRAATIDFAETRGNAPGQFNTLGRQGRHGPTLELPDSPDGGLNALRGVKSFADLRSYTPSPSLSTTSGYPQGGSGSHTANVAQYGEYSASLGQPSALTTPTTPGAASSAEPSMLINELATLNLTEPFNNGARLRPREAPGAIGSQRPGLNGTSTRSVPERQPHGPSGEWGEKIGFGGRGRANGHIQRGSDSSDNGVRTTSSSTSRFQ